MGRTDHFLGGAGLANPRIAAGAQEYAQGLGLARPDLSTFRSTYAHPNMTSQIASAYNAMPAFDEQAVPHFQAMAQETERQFDYLTKSRRRGGLGVNVEVTPHDPYSGPAEMFRDLHENNRIKVMSTATTGAHPIFTNSQNDQFRAIHDAFGHMGTGRGVDRHGEEAAFQSHSGMFTPLARRAMATETRGQNSSMIAAGGTFPPQKIGLLPAHLATPMTAIVGRRTQAFHAGALAQAHEFHSAQFPGVKML